MSSSAILRISAYVSFSIPRCSALALNFMNGNFSANGSQVKRNEVHEMIERVDVSISLQHFVAIRRFRHFL